MIADGLSFPTTLRIIAIAAALIVFVAATAAAIVSHRRSTDGSQRHDRIAARTILVAAGLTVAVLTLIILVGCCR